jgi:hypothetical protein
MGLINHVEPKGAAASDALGQASAGTLIAMLADARVSAVEFLMPRSPA